MTVVVPGQNFVLPGSPVKLATRGAVELGALYGIAVLPEGGPGWLSLQDGRTDWLFASGEDAVEVLPDRLPSNVSRVHVGIYARRSATTMRGFLPATFDVTGNVFRVEADSFGATFLCFAELYLRNGEWKGRARSDWDIEGVAAFARRHGSHVTDDSGPVIGEADPAPPPRSEPVAGDWSGSAFLVGNGMAATNAHVVEGAGRIVAVGDAGRFDVETVVMDEAADIALVRIKGCGSPPPVPFRGGFDLSPGEQVYAIGFPLGGFLGAGPQITPGMVASCLGPANDTRLMQISTPIQPGSSGGPVLDPSGRLVGVATASLNGAQNVNFAVRSALVSYLAQSVGVDVVPAGDASPIAPDRILRAVRGTLFKLECSPR